MAAPLAPGATGARHEATRRVNRMRRRALRRPRRPAPPPPPSPGAPGTDARTGRAAGPGARAQRVCGVHHSQVGRLAERRRDRHALQAGPVVAAVVFVVVEGALLYSLIKFRARKGAVAGPDPRQHAPGDRLDGRRRADPRRARRRHVRQAAGASTTRRTPAPTGCSSPPARSRLEPDQTPPPNGKSLNICVNGQQYIWRYTYAQRLRQRRRSSSPFSYQEMVVPVDTTVTLDIQRPGRRALVVDPAARRQVRRHPRLHEPHLVQDPRQARRHRSVHRPVRRAVRAQPREHDRARSGPSRPTRVRELARPRRGRHQGRRRPGRRS